jgi:multicomponent Na+:H+ antiporter subunit C
MNDIFEFIAGHYDYWFIILLLAIGLYGMTIKKNLVKKLIGMTIFQAAIILFYISNAIKADATVPILAENLSPENSANYINPLPHALMLTAIVVGVATVGVAFALLILIYKNCKTLDEDELLERMK